MPCTNIIFSGLGREEGKNSLPFRIPIPQESIFASLVPNWIMVVL
jgi:hypothetical protein